MLTDALNWLSAAQALTSGTAYSNAYDNKVAGDIGRGTPIRAVCYVSTTFAGGTSLTVNFVESANADLSSPTVLIAGTAVVDASLTAGARLMDTVIPKTTKRYYGFQFVNSGTHSAGAVNALMTLDTDSGDTFAVATGY